MVNLVVRIAQYVIFSLLAKAIADLSLELLADLATYVIVLIGVLMMHLFVTLMLIFKFFSSLNLAIFIRKIYET